MKSSTDEKTPAEKQALLTDAVKYMRALIDGSADRPIQGAGIGIINKLQRDGGGVIKEKSRRDMLIELMVEPQLIDGESKIYPTGIVSLEIIKTLTEKIQDGTFKTEEDTHQWIFATYNSIYQYIIEREHKGKEQSTPPTDISFIDRIVTAIDKNKIESSSTEDKQMTVDPFPTPWSKQLSAEKKIEPKPKIEEKKIEPIDYSKYDQKFSEKHKQRLSTIETKIQAPGITELKKTELRTKYGDKVNSYSRDRLFKPAEIAPKEGQKLVHDFYNKYTGKR